MTVRLQCVCLLLILGVRAYSAPEAVYSDLKDAKQWFRIMIVPEDELSVARVEQAARSFLATAAGRSVVVLSIFTNRHDVGMSVSASRDSYAQWRVYYDEASKKPLRTAQAIAINGNCALRVRQADGTVDTRILAGTNPLRLDSDGAVFEILMLEPRVSTKFDQCEPRSSISPIVYAKTDAVLTKTLCEKATDRLSRLLGTRKLFVHFRNDQWFISFGGFPVLYPFSTGQTPPTETAYYKSKAFTCGVWCGQTASCTQTLGPPLKPPGTVPTTNVW